jgi:alkylation response protein AidB-like acyl-CoA dehydrogenase
VRFAPSDDQRLLQQAARAFLDEHCTSAVVRAAWDSSRGEADGLWKEMAALGWLGLALPEAAGGAGLGLVETALVQEELGRVAYPGPYLPTVLAGWAIAEAGSEAQRSRWLADLAAGQARASVALLDDDLGWEPGPGATRAEASGGGRVTLTGVKRFAPWAAVADLLVVPARGPAGPGCYLVATGGPGGSPGVSVEPAPAMDVGTRWATVRLDRAPAEALGPPASGLAEALLRRGAVGAAAEMLGAARRALDLSLAHAKVREQFGQPIGSFQAVRHRLAEMLLAVENAHAATYYAAWATDAGAPDAALAASVAKVHVSEAAWKACGDAIQVHGGIGFTWEYDLHLYAKRVRALQALFGDADHHRELIVRYLAG